MNMWPPQALAGSLARFEAPQPAFADYERKRLGLANRMVRLSRQASRSVLAENPFTSALRNALVSMVPKGMILTVLDMNFGRPAA